jgi:hypothetical protein
MKIAVDNAHDKCEHVAPCTTAEAVENLFLGMNVERGMPFFVQRTKSQELAPAAPELRKLPGEYNQVNASLQLLRV